MKKHFISYILLLLMSIGAQAQSDVTAQYIQSSDFTSTDGWTEEKSYFGSIGTGQIGTFAVHDKLPSIVSTADGTHLSTEFCAGFECRWSSNFSAYTQTVNLPAGVYTLTYDVENCNSDTKSLDYENRFYVKVGETTFSDTSTEWMQSNTNWTTHSISFTIVNDGNATISLGFGTGSNDNPQEETPVLYVSHLKLASASADNPMTTNFVVNGTFDDGITGWSRTGNLRNNQTNTNIQGDFTGTFYENWDVNPMVNKMYQTITDIPNGHYKLRIAAFVNHLNGNPSATQYVYANDDKTYLTSENPIYYEVETYVTNNTIEIGLEQTTATANWMGMDNVSLIYYGLDQSFEARRTLEDALAYYHQYFDDNTTYARTQMSQQAGDELSTAKTSVTDALATFESNPDAFDYTAFTAAAAALNNEVDAARTSMTLWKRYMAFIEGNTSLGLDVSSYNQSSEYAATDYDVERALTPLSEQFYVYVETGSHEPNFDVSAFLGTNLDGSSALGDQVDATKFPRMYAIEGWDLITEGLTEGGEWIATGKNTNDGTYSNNIYLRKGWYGKEVTLQFLKERMLPAGNYTFTYTIATQATNIAKDLSYFSLGGKQTSLANTSASWTTYSKDFSISDNTTFDLSFGFETNDVNVGAENAPQIMVTNISLIYRTTSLFQFALNSCREAMASDPSGAAAAAVAQWESYEASTEAEEMANFGGDANLRIKAIHILNNAKAIANNSGCATSLITNADFKGSVVAGTVDDGKEEYPSGWTFINGHSGKSDVWTDTDKGVFNSWAATITQQELMQTLSELPNGQYKLTAKVATNGAHDGSSRVALYGNPTGCAVGRSPEVVAGPGDFDFEEVELEFKVLNNQVTIGIRSDQQYYQVMDFQLYYVQDDPSKVDDACLQQAYYWGSNNGKRYFDGYETDLTNATDLTVFSQARNATIYPHVKNQMMYVSPELDQMIGVTFIDGTKRNVVVVDNGVKTCNNLVITDLEPLNIQNGPFTATTATYTRDMTYYLGTVILPYPITENKDVHYYDLITYVNGTDQVSDRDKLRYNHVASVVANHPVLFRKMDGREGVLTIQSKNVEVVNTQNKNITTSYGWTHQGFYYNESSIDDKSWNNTEANVYYIAHNHFWVTEGTVLVRPFRTLYRSNGGGANLLGIILDDDGIVDGIDAIKGEANSVKHSGIYSISGQKVSDNTNTDGLAPGLYIINGKKVLVK